MDRYRSDPYVHGLSSVFHAAQVMITVMFNVRLNSTIRSLPESEMIEHINGFSISENDPLQYVCIAEPIFDLRKAELYCLSIQIIFKKRKIRRLNFLDRYAGKCALLRTRTSIDGESALLLVGLCNYLVTRNELAWNEYLKKSNPSSL